MYLAQFSSGRFRKVVLLQAALGTVAALGAWYFAGSHAAAAAAFGAVVALVNSGLLAWHMRRALLRSPGSPGQELARLLWLAAQRWAAVAALLAAGFALLGLHPLALVTGLAAGQTGLMLSGLLVDERSRA